MPDSTVWTAAISAGSVLAAGLGSVSLTHRGTIRREERQAERRREEQRVLERRQAYADLLGAAAQLRVRVRAASQRQWPDMNIRLSEVQERAAVFDRQAWSVALLSPESVARAAHALTQAADGLVGHVVTKTTMGGTTGPDEQFVSGVLHVPADFSGFEDCLRALQQAMTEDVRAGCPPITAAGPGQSGRPGRPGQPGQPGRSSGRSSGPWWTSRRASSS